MKFIFLFFTFFSIQAQSEIVVQTRIANDYSLFDEIQSITVLNQTITSDLVGSEIHLSVKGAIATRDCGYTEHAIFLRPKATNGLHDENYDVNVGPIFKGESVELSFHPCNDIGLVPKPFEAKVHFVVRQWMPSWSERTYRLRFLGVNGIVLKELGIQFTRNGWNIKK